MRFHDALASAMLLFATAVPVGAGTVDIVRDKWGVPHIFVPSTLGGKTARLKALGFAEGYAIAQDRMVQLEFFRRAARVACPRSVSSVRATCHPTSPPANTASPTASSGRSSSGCPRRRCLCCNPCPTASTSS